MGLKISKIFFIAAILAVFFAYGYLSHMNRIFPYKTIEEARISFNALTELHSDKASQKTMPGVEFWETGSGGTKKSNTLSEAAGTENLFFLGNQNTLLDHCPEDGCLAWIADRQGNILHVWKNFPDLWKPLENRDAFKDAWSAYPVGAYLFANGDILVSYQGREVFPIPMGLAKFNKDSNLIWKRNGFYHHWFSVDPGGRIYIGGANIIESPFPVKNHMKYFECEDKRFHYEPIVVLDPDGNIIKEIDTLEAMVRSDLTGIFNNGGNHRFAINTCDPMHLNDVRVLSEKMARQFPDFAPGDLLLSFRSLNGVGVLDPDKKLFKWFYVGAVHRQHSPRFIDNNRILVFDNLGGDTRKNSSRVVSINVSTGQTQTMFPKKRVKIPERSFYSEVAGHIDIHPGQKRMLVSWTHQGLVWEIDIKSGKVLWEHVNTHQLDNQLGRIPVYTALYTGDLAFAFNRGKLP